MLSWKDSAAIVFGYFQMIGFNRYRIDDNTGEPVTTDFITILERLDAGWVPEASVRASRELLRKVRIFVGSCPWWTPTAEKL